MSSEVKDHSSRAVLLASLAYAVMASLWILVSDWLLSVLIPDPLVRRDLSICKGWAFVAITAALLYGVMRRQLARQQRDFAARRQAEAALRESDNRFRALVEQSPDALFVHDLEGRLLDANRAAWESLGYTRDELLRLNVLDMERDFDASRLHTVLSKFQPGQTITLSGRHRRKDGSTFPVEVRVSTCDTGGQRLFQALVRDVTERQQAAAVLQRRLEVEERLSRIAAAVPGMIYSFRLAPDGSFSFPYVGAAVEESFGVPVAELTANADAGLRLIHPGDLGCVKQAIARSARDLAPVRIEFRICHKEKGELWIESTSSPQREKDGSVLWHGFIHDITERKRAGEVQARLAAAVEQAAEAIVITDPKAAILYVNPAFEKITGYRAAEALGQNPRILKSGRQDAAFYRKMWETLLKDGVWTGRMINQRKEGTLYQQEMTISSVLDHAGGVVNYVAVARDVSREVHLEEQLRQAQKMEAIGQLAGGVAHDFNNILTVIQGNTSILLEPPVTSADVTECANQILLATERAANLTRQLLVFSRKQAIKPVCLELNEVLAAMTRMLRRILGEDIVLHSEFAPELPPVLADAGMIEQVLLNLAVNSRDAMPEGGRLTIATSTLRLSDAEARRVPGARPGRFVCLSVTDTGCGIPPESLPHLFEPFFTTKEVGRGTGLGLATVHGIVQQHRGWIEVASEPGKGAAFHLRFPALEGTRTTELNRARALELFTGTETILVAEDEPTVRELVVNLLSRCGYRVLAAESGVAAFRLWQEHRPEIQLLLTDLVMPGGLTGFALAEKIRAEKADLPVIYTSGYSTEMRKAERLGEDATFLQKPYSTSDLTRLVRQTLDHA
jgi:PAS domain S-box-containing protein